MTKDSSNNWFRKVSSLGYEMIPVILGVFLALALNNYQQTLSEKKFIRKVLSTIREENAVNIDRINEILDKQKRTVDSLQFYAGEDETTIFDVIMKVRGLSTPDLTNTAASMISSERMALVDYEIIRKLAQVAKEQENFDMNTQIMINLFYENLHNTGSDSKLAISFVLMDIISYEKNLLRYYSEFEELFKDGEIEID